MRLGCEFPSVVYREGPEGVARLARAIEEIGYDQLDVFDHVVMAHPAPGRPQGPYPAAMPILEALTFLAFAAGVTQRIGLGTEVLVLPQRQPVLVAKQAATIDLLSGERLRLGVGSGWQAGEYEALGAEFRGRGRALDDGIALLRKCWRDPSIDHEGRGYRASAVAMEPKPRRGGPEIWIGGHSPAALARAGRVGDGWLAAGLAPEQGAQAIEEIRLHALAAGRDPSSLGFQLQLSLPPRIGETKGRDFYAAPDAVAGAAAEAQRAGFDAVAVNATGVFVAGARKLDALIDALGTLHEHIRRETGRSSTTERARGRDLGAHSSSGRNS